MGVLREHKKTSCSCQVCLGAVVRGVYEQLAPLRRGRGIICLL